MLQPMIRTARYRSPTRGFAAVGRLLADIDCPTVFVHEGGYVLSTLAEHTLAVLTGFESRPAR